MDLWNEPVRGFVREGMVFEHWLNVGKEKIKLDILFLFILIFQ